MDEYQAKYIYTGDVKVDLEKIGEKVDNAVAILNGQVGRIDALTKRVQDLEEGQEMVLYEEVERCSTCSGTGKVGKDD